MVYVAELRASISRGMLTRITLSVDWLGRLRRMVQLLFVLQRKQLMLV